jgi:hypothetical protein
LLFRKKLELLTHGAEDDEHEITEEEKAAIADN